MASLKSQTGNHFLGYQTENQKMAKNGTQVIEISPSPSERYSEEEEDNGTPLRPVFCVKRNTDIKRIEEIEECFILDFDPFDSIDISKLSVSNSPIDNEVSVVAEKGQVACRDYPHSRHLCMKFPFETTPHEQYCKLCYCYVCDSSAPCKYWMQHEQAHCHASEKVGDWKSRRNLRKKLPVVWD
ncbi:RPM1 interacting protein 13-like [Castanea sativa]|uniref:RPM1 interacting protein 13-like n=1 Tax=Castanea sativa TaxID=21020 RepID=UPI003F64DC80